MVGKSPRRFGCWPTCSIRLMGADPVLLTEHAAFADKALTSSTASRRRSDPDYSVREARWRMADEGPSGNARLTTMRRSDTVSDRSEFASTSDRIGAIVYTQFLVGTFGAFFGGGREIPSLSATSPKVILVGK
jgi:hypothetical protein